MATTCPECNCEVPGHYGLCSRIPPKMRAAFESAMRQTAIARAATKQPTISNHLATLNLWREHDGSLRITVAEAVGGRKEYESRIATDDHTDPPIKYIEQLIKEAAKNL